MRVRFYEKSVSYGSTYHFMIYLIKFLTEAKLVLVYNVFRRTFNLAHLHKQCFWKAFKRLNMETIWLTFAPNVDKQWIKFIFLAIELYYIKRRVPFQIFVLKFVKIVIIIIHWAIIHYLITRWELTGNKVILFLQKKKHLIIM